VLREGKEAMLGERTTLIVVLLLLVFVGTTRADRYGFACISNNSSIDAAIGESQLFVEVTDAGLSGGNYQALFTFRNEGLDPCSIVNIYFDDGTLLGIASIDDSHPNVDFGLLADPSNLPSANSISPPFVTTAGFSADSESPKPHNGVNPGEFVGITFDLKDNGTFADVINELADGRLRIGIHAQGFGNDGEGSESFVTVVPAPAAVVLVLIGVGLLGSQKSRRWLGSINL